jgi:hypothetical protein
MKNLYIKSPETQNYESALCPEDGGSTFPRNIYKFLKLYKVSLSDDKLTAVGISLANNFVIKIFILNRFKTEYKKRKR